MPAISMSQPNPDTPNNRSDSETDAADAMDIDEWLERLRRADQSLYHMMSLEVWSIAKTMDSIVPGFWSRFMMNRQISLKHHIQQKYQKYKGRTVHQPVSEIKRDQREEDEP
jgi:hypothetical protein